MAYLTMRQIASYCYAAGFRGNALITATAVAMAESSGKTDAVNSLGCTGLFQIYIKAHIKSHPTWTTAAMKQPYNNAKAAYELSSGGKNWRPWEAYTKGMHKKYMSSAKVAVQQTLASKSGSSGSVATTTSSTPVPAGPTVSKALAIAQSQVGYKEQGNNRTKYHTDMGLGYGQPWCACFTSWVLWKAGFSKTTLKKMLGSNLFLVFGIRDYAKAHGMWKSSPQPGDLVVFSYSHMEIVEKVFGKHDIQTIGGNTSSGNSGSQNNGDGVWRRHRTTSIQGYIRIPYDSAGPAGILAGVTQVSIGDITGIPTPDAISQSEMPKPDIDANGILNENGFWNTATAIEFAKYAKIPLPITTSAAYWKSFEKTAGFPVKFQDGELDHETIQYLQWYTEQKTLDGIWNATTVRGVQSFLNKKKREAAEASGTVI